MAIKPVDETTIAQQENEECVEAMPNHMRKEEFDAVMQVGYEEALSDIGYPIDEAFEKINACLAKCI